MAVYFLEKSATYRQQTSKEIWRRREVVCQHLNDAYKVGRNRDDEAYRQVASVLKAEQVEITTSTFQADKVLVRNAFLWLTATTAAEKEKFANTTSPSGKVGINCLIKDGLQSWEQLGYGTTQKAADTDGTSTEEVAPPAPAALPKKKFWDYQASKPVLTSITGLVTALEGMLEENEELKQRLADREQQDREVVNRSADDQSYIELVEGELAKAEQRIKELRETIRSTQISAHAASLETIAEENPDFPQLTVIAQQLKERRGKQGKASDLASKLPVAFTWPSDTGRIEYRDHFLRALESMTAEEQAQTIGGLESLATQGLEYGALHTRKTQMRLPFSPPDCMVSRGSDVLRFTWEKNGAVTIYWLYRKGDSRVRQSEA